MENTETMNLIELTIGEHGINANKVAVEEHPKTFRFLGENALYKRILPKEHLKKPHSKWNGMIFYCLDNEEDIAECIHEARETLKRKVEESTKALQKSKDNLHKLNESLKKFHNGKFKVK